MTVSAKDAWITLGKDPQAVFGRLAALPRSERVAAARADLVEAKRLARILMAAHHPDRGGSPESFRRVNDAMISLEAHTEEFAKAMAEADAEIERRQASRPAFIKVG